MMERYSTRDEALAAAQHHINVFGSYVVVRKRVGGPGWMVHFAADNDERDVLAGVEGVEILGPNGSYTPHATA